MELSEATWHLRHVLKQVLPPWPVVISIRTVLDALEWRPISEAPKDGTEVLLFVPDDVVPGYVYLAGFDNGWSGEGEWVDTHGATVEGATHFRHIGPLPEVKE